MYEISDIDVPEVKAIFETTKMTIEFEFMDQGISKKLKLIFIKVT